MNAHMWWALIAIATLVIGTFGGALIWGGTETVEVPGATKYVNVTQEVEVPGPEIEVADASLYLDTAIEDVFSELDNDDDFLTCEDNEYDDSEISVSRVKEWSYTWFDDDEYAVEFTAKLKFDEDGERACRDTRTYNVLYEEGEDPEVELVE